MKTVFIVFNQALNERVEALLNHHNIGGFTRWADVQGRGTEKGEPHLGTHTWPAMNSAILTVISEEKVEPMVNSLRKLNEKSEMQGLRVFVWTAESVV